MMTKTLASAALALGLLISLAGEANAVVCRAGAYGAGCASARGAAVRHPYGAAAVARPYGAAAVRHPYGAAAVARPVGGACVWRAGVRVCR